MVIFKIWWEVWRALKVSHLNTNVKLMQKVYHTQLSTSREKILDI